MKKVLFTLTTLLITSLGITATAQEDLKNKDDKKENQEIIIRKKGDKDANINIQITGDQVLVNGKPMMEFKDDGITINKRKIIIRDGDRVLFGDGLRELEGLENLSWMDGKNMDKNTAFLGVITEKNDKGAQINEVTKESAAAKAGLKENDIIIKIDDTKIDGPESLSKAITAKKPTDEVIIIYLRNGKEKSTRAILQKRKQTGGLITFSSPDGTHKELILPGAQEYADKYRNYSRAPRPGQFNNEDFEYNFDMNSYPRQKKLGLKIQDTEDDKGVKVLEVADSSAAAIAGVKKDDIITEIGGVKVTNTDEVRNQLQENSEKSSYPIKVKRNGNDLSFIIKIPKKLKTANL